MGKFFNELKRRNVFRVGVAYLVVAWLVIQVVNEISEPLSLPANFPTIIIVLLAIGFPIALVFAWAFELTPDGVKKTEEVDPEYSQTASTGQKLNILIIAFLLLIVGYLSWDKFKNPAPENAVEPVAASQVAPDQAVEIDKADSTASIAVLPFADLSPENDQEYFSDGIAEELLNVLTRVPGLKVAARTSSFYFKGQNKPIGEIAKVLGVQHVLEGSVRKAGDQLRITAQLIRAEDGFHLWSDTYDRKLENIFAIQDDIAQAIVGELRSHLVGEVKIDSSGTTNTEAYQEYLKGRYFWNLRGVDNLYIAIEHFNLAIELDPGFSDAWEGLAESWAVLPGWEYNVSKVQSQFQKAEHAAKKALQINEKSGRAYAVLGNIQSMTQVRDRNLAEEYFRKAIELEPESASTWHWYSISLMAIGRFDEAEKAMDKAMKLDPLSRIIGANASMTEVCLGDYDKALERIENTLSYAPDFSFAWKVKGLTWLLKHEFTEARVAFEKRRDLEGRTGYLDILELVKLYVETGKTGVYPDWIRNRDLIDPYISHILLLEAGFRNETVEQLRYLIESPLPDAGLYYSQCKIMKEKLSDLPAYRELMNDLGF